MTETPAWSDLALAYVSGELTEAERRRFAARLAEDAALRAEVRALEEGLVGLALAAPELRPPTAAWANIQAAITRSAGDATAGWPWFLPALLRPWQWVAGSVAVLVAVVVWLYPRAPQVGDSSTPALTQTPGHMPLSTEPATPTATDQTTSAEMAEARAPQASGRITIPDAGAASAVSPTTGPYLTSAGMASGSGVRIHMGRTATDAQWEQLQRAALGTLARQMSLTNAADLALNTGSSAAPGIPVDVVNLPDPVLPTPDNPAPATPAPPAAPAENAGGTNDLYIAGPGASAATLTPSAPEPGAAPSEPVVGDAPTTASLPTDTFPVYDPSLASGNDAIGAVANGDNLVFTVDATQLPDTGALDFWVIDANGQTQSLGTVPLTGQPMLVTVGNAGLSSGLTYIITLDGEVVGYYP